jgi:hypothetical protein
MRRLTLTWGRQRDTHIYMCPHTTTHTYTCVLILLHTYMHVSSYYYTARQRKICMYTTHITYADVRSSKRYTHIHVSSYYYLCVLILLYMCLHSTIYASSFYYICVLILLQMFPHTYYICVLIQHNYICVFIHLYMGPHTTMHVSSYCYMCVLILPYKSYAGQWSWYMCANIYHLSRVREANVFLFVNKWIFVVFEDMMYIYKII